MFKIIDMKVNSPSCIWGRVVCDDVHSSTQYNTLLSQMNIFYSDVHQDCQKLVPSTIEEGQVYVVYWSCIKSWCRAKVEAVINDSVPVQACCFLVDHGEILCVPKDQIRIGLQKYLQLPFWVRRFHLARIKPMKLHVSPCEELAELIPSSQWDSSATLYLHRLLQASTLVEAVLLVKECESTAIELYMTIDSFKICVNDDLVAKRFANYRRQPTDNCLLDREDRTPLMLSPNILSQTVQKPMLKLLECTPPCPVLGEAHAPCKDVEIHFKTAVTSQSIHKTLNGDGLQSNFPIHDNKSNNWLLNGSDEGKGSKDTEGHWPPLDLPSTSTSESDLSADSSSASAVNENQIYVRSSGHLDLSNGDQQTASMDNLEHSDHQPEKTSENSAIFTASDFDRQESVVVPKALNKGARLCQSFLMCLNPALLKTSLDEESRPLLRVEPMRNGILVHSALPPLEPCSSLDDIHLTEALCRELKRRRHPYLSPSESHSWPPLLQGCNTLIISTNADDLLTSIPPLLQHIMLNSIYCSHTTSTGPIAVVLCPGWERVQMVDDLLTDLKVSRLLNTATVLLGLGKDEAKEFRISKNSLFIVTTPFSLVRLLSCHCFLFLRVHHLILDQADQLFTHAAVQMSTILQHFKKIASSEENHGCPHQLVATSKKWTNEMEDLVASYMTHPSIIISSPEEAAFYGEVHQMVRVTVESSKISVLLGSLDFSPDVGQKTLVIANSPKEAEEVFKAVSSKSAFCLKLHEGLTDQIEEVLLHWRKDITPGSHILLVTTDECLTCLEISDATCVIHYSFPTSPKCFGRRLFCMADYFRNLSGVRQEAHPKGCPPVARSLVLISERNARHVPGIVRYMKRTNAMLPSELLSFAEAIQAVQEEQSSSLCSSLKSLGFCSNASKCLDRHRYDSILDASELPSSGIIEVVPLHVKTASVYYGRVLSGDTDFERMMSELASYYTEKNMGMVEEVLEGGLYAVEENNTFHRVKVLSVLDRGDRLFFSVLAEFIDVGKKEEVRAHQLLPLPESFHSLPSQAVEIILCQLKPTDAETQWHPKVTRVISQKIEGVQHRARAVFALGKTVFVDCMVRVTKVPGIKTQINEYNVKSLILNTGMAEENLQHLDVLQALCRKDAKGVGESKNLFGSTNGHLSQADATNTEDEVLLKAFQEAQLDGLAHIENTNLKSDMTNRLDSSEPPSNGDCYLESTKDQPQSSQSPAPFPSNNSEEEISNCLTSHSPPSQKAVSEEPHVQLVLTQVENKDLPQSLHPQVHWYQTLDSVIVTVKLIAPGNQKCGFFPDKVIYSGQVNGHTYRVDLQLQGTIIADRCSWQMKSNEPVLKLVKLQSGRWDRLVKSKNIFVSYDLAHLDEEEYDEMEKRNTTEHNHTPDFYFTEETGEENWYTSSDSGSESD